MHHLKGRCEILGIRYRVSCLAGWLEWFLRLPALDNKPWWCGLPLDIREEGVPLHASDSKGPRNQTRFLAGSQLATCCSVTEEEGLWQLVPNEYYGPCTGKAGTPQGARKGPQMPAPGRARGGQLRSPASFSLGLIFSGGCWMMPSHFLYYFRKVNRFFWFCFF